MDTLLTTKDNPFSPFTDYDQWKLWDEQHGYYTEQIIARASNPSFDLTDEEQEELYDMAVLTILEHDLTEQYILVQGNTDGETDEPEPNGD